MNSAEAKLEINRLTASVYESIEKLRSLKWNFPDHAIRDYAMSPGGVLNAYREGDLAFNDAVLVLNSLKQPPTATAARPDRIGSECWYRDRRGQSAEWTWKRGRILNWSTDHEEYETGPGPFPAAVVEDLASGDVSSVYVGLISFSAEMPQDAK